MHEIQGFSTQPWASFARPPHTDKEGAPEMCLGSALPYGLYASADQSMTSDCWALRAERMRNS